MKILRNHILNLKTKNKKSKERLKRDGTKGWRVLEVKNTVLFSLEKGPWLRIEKIKKNNIRITRWIHQYNDPNFGIVDEI